MTVRKSSQTVAWERLVGAEKPSDTQELRRGLEDYRRSLQVPKAKWSLIAPAILRIS